MFPMNLDCICVYCEGVNKDVYADFERGQTDFQCEKCGKWNALKLSVTPVTLEERGGEKSPAWDAAVDLLNFRIRQRQQDVPFFSETALYELLGKQDARTVLGHIARLLRSVGIEKHNIPYIPTK